MKNKFTLFHGSREIIESPSLLKSNPQNDYGRGFYCTESIELAREWACFSTDDGYVNSYELDVTALRVLNLSDKKYNILNWLALLLKNRVFAITSPVSGQAKEYITVNFSVDTSDADVIIGYRADDSYFSFAKDFVNNNITVQMLASAMFLGNLGEQVVLMSGKAFETIRFTGHSPVDGKIYNAKRLLRDKKARDEYLSTGRKVSALSEGDLFIADIIRGGIKNNDARIQRIIP
ncbi:MAG: DUF3990 domain-containing protein [Firmicutes bacterium]|nr:DUF3990 domain-containing protein [Bacillota bacterium]